MFDSQFGKALHQHLVCAISSNCSALSRKYEESAMRLTDAGSGGSVKLSVNGQASGIGLATAKAFHEAEHLQSEWLSEISA